MEQPLSHAYWAENMVSPVRFYPAFKNLLRHVPNGLFLEIGPHTQLAGPVREICAEAHYPYTYVPTMIRQGNLNRDAPQSPRAGLPTRG